MAQQPFPTFEGSGQWNVMSCFWTDCVTRTLQFTDTIAVCDHTYGIIPVQGFDPGTDTIYVRNDGQRTLFRHSVDCSAKEYVLYDFSLAAGDSVFVGHWGSPDTAVFLVDAIDTVNIAGVDRRRFHMLFDPCGEDWLGRPMDWIEGIGSTTHPFHPLVCLCDACENAFRLLCCDSADVQIYRDTLFGTCSYHTGIDDVAQAERSFRATMEPTSGQVRVQLPDGWSTGELEFKDAVGRSLARYVLPGNDREPSFAIPGAFIAVLRDHEGAVLCAKVAYEER